MNVAKVQSNSNLLKPSAKADGNKTIEELMLLLFTKVNGLPRLIGAGCCSRGFNPISKFLSILTKCLIQ